MIGVCLLIVVVVLAVGAELDHRAARRCELRRGRR